MYTKRILIIAISWLFILKSNGQATEKIAQVETHSLELYNAANWKELIIYGKENIAAGNDFVLLRMRIGYAAFMLGDFSQSLLQYKKILKEEPDNNIASYYVYLNNVYLNNITAARYYAKTLPDATPPLEKPSSLKLSSIETEYSYKMPSDTFRKNAQYVRVGLNLQIGSRWELQQSIASYNQVINEVKINKMIPPPFPPPYPPNFVPRYTQTVKNSQHIDIQQKEYYAKLIFSATGSLSLMGGFHYLYTPFNNLIYKNAIFFGGIKYTTPYAHFSAMAHVGNISDNTSKQFDVGVTLFPLGNTKLYTISKAAYNDHFTFSQVAGCQITKGIWLEANATFGKFNVLFENDGLFVYNDIDQKIYKAGGSIYAALSKKLLFSFNYAFEKKLKYLTTDNYFNQQSITGGLTWKF